MIRRRLQIAIATGLLFVMGTSVAAAPPALTVGMTVSDPAGGVVGTIDSLTTDNAVVSTGAHKVALPLSSFGTGDKGPVIAMTKVELEAAAAKAAQTAATATRAQLIPGTAISGLQGNALGTVKAIDGDLVVLTTAEGDARVPVTAITSGPNGLILGMTAADFQAAISPAK